MTGIEVILNGTSGKEVKRVLVHIFGNSIAFRELSGAKNKLIITSTQEAVIKDLMVVMGLTVTGEEI